MKGTKEQQLKEKEVAVQVVKDEGGEEKIRVIEDPKIIEQLHHEITETEYVKRLILLSKIAAGVSIISLIISLTLLGMSATADVIKDEGYTTKATLSIVGFVLGLFTFMLALHLDKKSKKKKVKKTKKKTRKRKTKKK